FGFDPDIVGQSAQAGSQDDSRMGNLLPPGTDLLAGLIDFLSEIEHCNPMSGKKKGNSLQTRSGHRLGAAFATNFLSLLADDGIALGAALRFTGNFGLGARTVYHCCNS